MIVANRSGESTSEPRNKPKKIQVSVVRLSVQSGSRERLRLLIKNTTASDRSRVTFELKWLLTPRQIISSLRTPSIVNRVTWRHRWLPCRPLHRSPKRYRVTGTGPGSGVLPAWSPSTENCRSGRHARSRSFWTTAPFRWTSSSLRDK